MRVTIVEYDSAWPRRYEAECERLAALTRAGKRFEHIGSTSVPGLAAKPIIDLLLTVDDVDDEAVYRPQLEACGYRLSVIEPGHRMFMTPSNDVHLHVWRSGCDEERRYLLFRDLLRRNADDRRLYETVKRELSRREWVDANAYADAKTDVISSILARAAVSSAPAAALTTVDHFFQIDIRAGTVIEADLFPEARKPALKLLLDFGPTIGRRRSSAQITRRYEPHSLIGRKLAAVVNLPPRRIGPFLSEVLILGFADTNGDIVLFSPDSDVPNGARLQ